MWKDCEEVAKPFHHNETATAATATSFQHHINSGFVPVGQTPPKYYTNGFNTWHPASAGDVLRPDGMTNGNEKMFGPTGMANGMQQRGGYRPKSIRDVMEETERRGFARYYFRPVKQ